MKFGQVFSIVDGAGVLWLGGVVFLGNVIMDWCLAASRPKGQGFTARESGVR